MFVSILPLSLFAPIPGIILECWLRGEVEEICGYVLDSLGSHQRDLETVEIVSSLSVHLTQGLISVLVCCFVSGCFSSCLRCREWNPQQCSATKPTARWLNNDF